MSSPLDGRIRKLAREEAAAILGAPPVAGASASTLEQMQQQINDLHEHLHMAVTAIGKLEQRLDATEKATGQTDQEQQRPAMRRVPRKEGTK